MAEMEGAATFCRAGAEPLFALGGGRGPEAVPEGPERSGARERPTGEAGNAQNTATPEGGNVHVPALWGWPDSDQPPAQYSLGSSTHVEERSASVMTQNFPPFSDA
jgi:hypothetical protein